MLFKLTDFSPPAPIRAPLKIPAQVLVLAALVLLFLLFLLLSVAGVVCSGRAAQQTQYHMSSAIYRCHTLVHFLAVVCAHYPVSRPS